MTRDEPSGASGFDVRLIAPGEVEACNEFHNRTYGTHRTARAWRWEFEEHGFDRGPTPYAVVAADGRIAATQALIPIRMIDAGGVYWTAKSEETLVDPAFRGQRLFERMYQLLFEYADRHELLGIWGFTYAPKAFRRLGFETPACTSQLLFPFHCRAIEALLRQAEEGQAPARAAGLRILGYRAGCALLRVLSQWKFAVARSGLARSSRLSALEVRTLTGPPAAAGSLCERFIRRWGGRTIYRDAEYLRWRIFENPYTRGVVRAVFDRGELIGWVIFTLGEDGIAYLVDLMAAFEEGRGYTADEIVQLLLVEAVVGTRNMGALALRGWSVNEHPFDVVVRRAAEQAGFVHVRRGHFAVLHASEAARAKRGIDRFGEWYVTRIFTEGLLG